MIEYKNEYLLTRFNGSGIRVGERKNMKFKVRKIYGTGLYYIRHKSKCNCLWKDGLVHTAEDYRDGKVNGEGVNGPSYWSTRKEAEIFLAGWLVLNPTSPPDLSKVDYEPEYELGTLYKDSVGITFQYVKLDFGITARDSNQKTYNYIQYRWFCVKL